MEILDIDVSEEEVGCLNNDLRPEFIPGSKCTVSACGEKTYNSLNTFFKHWKMVHRRHVRLATCVFCTYKSTIVNQIRRHYNKQHPSSPFNPKYVTAINKQFIDPKENMCYKRRSILKDIETTNKRNEAANLRHELASTCNGLVKETADCRDEVVLVSETDSNQFVKVKYVNPLWMKR